MAEITMGSLYEMNQQLVKKLPVLEGIKKDTALSSIGSWFSSHYKNHYYMLLCKEKSDYTVFYIPESNYLKAISEIQEVLESRGKIIAIDYVHGADAYECWVRDPEDLDVHMYMLFDYDWGVIECI